ncbi:mycothiol synthase [Nesterenkonia natronophila]|uniref:Mycothiol acetyltransferase n=1 Tax=Nesterenkonia natronophila TaxID=2174932 RepID=A0A3A4FA29_9MICC|nr:mycothiol synthase [Nesterenkonia natronophila]RJN31674.1 mycothiol synthase [Nesterenkonia natronophila]
MSNDVIIDLLEATPSPEQLHGLQELAAAAQASDGAPPFGDQTWVELGKSDGPSGVAVGYAWEPTPDGSRGRLVGAGVVVLGDSDQDADDAAPHTLELVVHPQCRERGVARQLGATLSASELAAQSEGHLRAWAHGGHPGGPRLAARFDWSPVRELWQMQLDNSVGLPRRELPNGVSLRSFRPGEDDHTWLRVNAEAFADHPEQGRLTLEDLQARMTEDWFSSEGFLLAWEHGSGGQERLIGFHWTKIHQQPQGKRVGEVYVVGVAPAAQGRALGAALTVAGIEYLRQQGVDSVILYVDADNAAAAGLYKKLGFTISTVDTQYAPGAERGYAQS